MSDEGVSQTPAVYSSKERAALVAKALSDAARRARFSTKRRRSFSAGSLRARRGERVFQILRIWTFIGIVAVPTVLFSLYIGLIASDQYVAQAQFTLMGGMPASLTSMGTPSGAPTTLIIQDTQVVVNFIESRAMVDALESSVDFRKMYGKAEVDYFSRLRPDIELFSKIDPNPPVESVTRYWNSRIDTEIQLPSGIVSLTVRAFDPQDVVKVTDAAIKASEAVVNRMNEAIQKDAVRLAEIGRQRAQASLIRSRSDLEKARNEQGILSAGDASTALTDLMATTQQQLISLQQEYDSQRKFVRATAPQLKSLQSKIDAAKEEIAKIQAQMTKTSRSKDDGDVKILSGAMTRLEYATLENSIAEKIYAASLAALEQARITSQTKLMYLNTFVRPLMPQTAIYPKVELDIFIFVTATLAVWGLVLSLLIFVRNSLL